MLKRYLILSALLVCFLTAHTDLYGQENNKQIAADLVEIAEGVLNETKAIVQACDMFIQAAETDPNNIKANFMAGQLCLETTKKPLASKYFKRVASLDAEYRFDINYLIARGYQYDQDYDNALKYYNLYRTKAIEEKNYRGLDRKMLSDVERRIFECENAKNYRANPANYKIVNVGGAINSEWDDYAPVLNEDETLMIFTSRRQEGNLNPDVFEDNFYYEDIFYSVKENGKWSPAQNIGENVNTLYFDSNIALSADGKFLYLFNDENGGDIYVSENLGNNEWSSPEPMDGAINSSFAENSISTLDGNTIFFSSNRPGGRGELDLYVATRDNRGNLTKVKNLGPTINTEYDEESPFIDYDGKTLYFSTRGREGMGGFDIFKTEYDSTTQEWSEPVNLGYPINTPDNDVFFVSTKDGKRGYYASVREDGMGFTDIYMVTVPDNSEGSETLAKEAEDLEKPDNKNVEANIQAKEEPETEETEEPAEMQPVIVMLKVRDADTRMPLESRVRLRTVEGNLEAGYERVEDGLYRFEVTTPEPTEYMLTVESDGYLFKNLKAKLPGTSPEGTEINRSIELTKLRTGVSSVLRNIYFDFNKATFTKDSYFELNKLERLLQENANISVEIAGHTDNIGAKAYNKDLSQARANAVVSYLANKGIDRRRLQAVGYGEEKPLASNDNEKDGRELNRRVEFRVVGE
ncbi:OmpA family protein [Roseivirga sp. BDSF3-8]|uniref:OmpA family protein n=1 Tax=Roseivirga sp. BDSF3-8 TaxID=3241598 RepID=UPI003532151C